MSDTPDTQIPIKLWEPSELFREKSHMQRYMSWVADRYHLALDSYDDLWQWSVLDVARFWQSIWDYFRVVTHSPYTSVLDHAPMPEARWFTGATLNYAEHVFRNRTDAYPAIVHLREGKELSQVSWGELERSVGAFAAYLKDIGIRPGDRVAAYMPNIPEATIAFLATISIGAVWSSCSQDFGIESVVDRFDQIKPKLIIATDGYSYNGKLFSRMKELKEISERISSIYHTVLVPVIDRAIGLPEASWKHWDQLLNSYGGHKLTFTAVDFRHPVFILYSSGTTGAPKAITHGHGGMLLEHLKYLHLHNDVQPGERFFWYSTTGWMMWNFTHAALLAGATIVLYDGSPAYPDIGRLWDLVDEAGIHHFGTSAPFVVASMKAGIRPAEGRSLSTLRSIGCTGSPLPPEAFGWIYANVSEEVWLCSMSGGTDVCTAFVGGNPLLPVYRGEIQSRALGCALYAFDEAGAILRDEVGEMVVTEPMPCMPVYFWNDPGMQKYRASYFEEYPGIWRHGDWVRVTPRGGVVIYGRSDATLNRQGVRIGTSEIYRSLDKIPEILDSLIVNLELSGGRHYMPLFVQLKDGIQLDDMLLQKIRTQLKTDHSPRHVPDGIMTVEAIPYTISGKKMEAPVKKILMGRVSTQSYSKDSMRNPEAMDFFYSFAQKIKEQYGLSN